MAEEARRPLLFPDIPKDVPDNIRMYMLELERLLTDVILGRRRMAGILDIAGDTYINGKLGIGTTSPKTKLHSITDTIVGCAGAAQADVSLGNSQVNIWVDESGNNITFKVKYSDGTVKSGTVALT